MWVCVSEDFSLKRMTKAIIEAETKNSCEDLDLEPLQRRLQHLLQGKRFLLVLDDVWDDKQENWQRLRSVLACGGKGASILVTTRLAKVAEIMGTIPPHDISKLSDEDCWELFKQRAFGSNEERTKLAVIVKEILKKCGGAPLAAIALGSLLRFKTEEKEWHYVKESKLWSLQDEDYAMPALRLSYLNLPLKLRQCFAFCALFPKDAIIRKQFLIELWMANGFISSNKILDEEDIDNDVWNELYCRSFFQDIETDVFGKITSFKMHDLVHDLAQSISDEVCCITRNDDMPSTFERIRHLSFGNRTSTKVDSILMYNVKLLRTYTSLYCHEYHLDVLKFHSLRVLKLTCVTRFPSSFSHLKFLRYLDLSVGEFETLPASLCKLWNLQILKLHYCRNLRILPNNLIHLKALQHLYLFGCFRLSSLPPNIGNLTSLRTLSMYVVGKGNLLAELGQLNFKVNEFHIKHLERVKNVEDAKEANMLSKHVNNLRLSWDEESQLQENVKQILEVLQPYSQQLQELWVEGYTGFHFPEWMSSSSLIHLRSMYLKSCKSCLHLPQLGKLPSLKELTIWSCSKIEGLGEDLQHVTSLQSLSLLCLPNLTSLPDSLGKLCSLQKLGIRDCPKLICLPTSIQSLSALKSLSICGCPELEKRCKRETGEDWPKISHIQNLHVFS
ncbi:putative P-loop containing nucleoside triphosphate hydrolase, leucine-rich repeat domain, L [Medicago truncatula]|uniref:Putative P-loop containing nucleoside triphosphate hydrolase, leucine-rich repeat domain, L n=1 Tax=Medicago truncatula TaxID=3880 RepID=A0A396HP18_MEDTR|nr:putative P-loop containing nucleoside triphosphate hydrolase, leucine-rich repeat domain, L [Medicago truncatula]